MNQQGPTIFPTASRRPAHKRHDCTPTTQVRRAPTPPPLEKRETAMNAAKPRPRTEISSGVCATKDMNVRRLRGSSGCSKERRAALMTLQRGRYTLRKPSYARLRYSSGAHFTPRWYRFAAARMFGCGGAQGWLGYELPTLADVVYWVLDQRGHLGRS